MFLLFVLKNGMIALQLRLLYEAAPRAFIMEKAGGLAVTFGLTQILDMVPTDIHETCPVVLGSTSDVEAYLQCVKNHMQTYSIRLCLCVFFSSF